MILECITATGRDLLKACEKINKMRIKLFIALPYILEQSRARQLSAMLDDIEHNTGIIDGYLVRKY